MTHHSNDKAPMVPDKAIDDEFMTNRFLVSRFTDGAEWMRDEYEALIKDGTLVRKQDIHAILGEMIKTMELGRPPWVSEGSDGLVLATIAAVGSKFQ